MLKGKIKLFIEDKKIGFIVQEDQTDLFFAKKQLQEKDYIPQKNDIVAYEIQPSPTKQDSFEAKNIIFLKEETEKMKETAKEEELEKEQNIQKERQKDLEKIEVLHGKIEWFNAQKGFGVIQSDKLGGVFFHTSNLGDCSWIEKNTPVKFRVTEKKNAPIDRKYTVISLDVDTFGSFVYMNNSYQRKNVFDKLNTEQQQKLLDYCQKNCDDEKLYLLWKEDYNLIPSINFLSQKFVNNSVERKTIFDKLSQEQQQELLDYCQKNCNNEKLYKLWKEGYNLTIDFGFISQKFILEINQRNDVFEKLNTEQQQELLDYCQKNCDDEKLYLLWKEGYNLIPSVDFLSQKFMNNSIERKTIFDKLSQEQQQELLDYCQKNCDKDKIYELLVEKYKINLETDILCDIFVDKYIFDECKEIFTLLIPHQQQALLTYCQKNCDDATLYDLWEEGYLVDINLDFIAKRFLKYRGINFKDSFKKLSLEQQKYILDYCEKNGTDKELYHIWKRDYNISYQTKYTFQEFILEKELRYSIFEKLSEEQQQELLQYCQKNGTDRQLCSIWKEKYSIPYRVEYTFQEFILEKNQRKNIFNTLNEKEQKELLVYCEKNTDDRELYEIWKEDYQVSLRLSIINELFLNQRVKISDFLFFTINLSTQERNNFFNKLNEQQQQELLNYCEKNGTHRQLYYIWKEKYNVSYRIEYTFQQFILATKERKSIFEKLNETEQKQLLEYCEKHANTRQLYYIWKQNYGLSYEIKYSFEEFILEANQRQTIFYKLNINEQKQLLEYCQKNCNYAELYEISYEGYKIDISYQNLFQLLFNNGIILSKIKKEFSYAEKQDRYGNYYFGTYAQEKIDRKFHNEKEIIKDKISNYLNSEKKEEILSYCQRNYDNEKLYLLWEEGYNLPYWLGCVSYKFMGANHDYQRKNIFQKLNTEQQQELLDYCQKNHGSRRLYLLWKEGYKFTSWLDFISKEFIDTSYDSERKGIFEKLNTEQQQEFLDYCQKNYEDEKLYIVWKEGYNLTINLDFITQKFIDGRSYEMGTIFKKLNPEQQQELLDYCQKIVIMKNYTNFGKKDIIYS